MRIGTSDNERIQTLALITADRPSLLCRSLVSYARHLTSHGRSDTEIVIADGSSSEDATSAVTATVGRISRNHRAPIYMIGDKEKQEAVRCLAAQGIPSDIARFALFGLPGAEAIGANRNAALLHSAGQLMISSDDDVICRLFTRSDREHGVVVVPNLDVAQTTFMCSSRRETRRSVQETNIGLLGVHERLLGRDVCDCLGDNDCPNDGHGRGGSVPPAAGLDGTVLITTSGVIGDSGMPSGAQLLFSRGETRSAYTATEQIYRRNRAGRWLTRLSGQFAVSRIGTIATTTATGFDVRGTLPAFLPCYRGEDSLFGITLSWAAGECYRGSVPVGMCHDPIQTRRNQACAVRPTVSGLIGALIGSIARPQGQDVAARIRQLGAELAALGAVGMTAFRESVSGALRRQWTLEIVACERALREMDFSPAYWARDVAELREDRYGALSRCPDVCLPREYGRLSVASAWALLQKLVLAYGRLLYWWPEMVHVAREWQSAGRHIGSLPPPHTGR